MKRLSQSNQFLKDIKRMRKRGKDIRKLQSVVNKLVNNETLHPRHRDHNLVGEWKTYRDCHIVPDWILFITLIQILFVWNVQEAIVTCSNNSVDRTIKMVYIFTIQTYSIQTSQKQYYIG